MNFLTFNQTSWIKSCGILRDILQFPLNFLLTVQLPSVNNFWFTSCLFHLIFLVKHWGPFLSFKFTSISLPHPIDREHAFPGHQREPGKHAWQRSRRPEQPDLNYWPNRPHRWVHWWWGWGWGFSDSVDWGGGGFEEECWSNGENSPISSDPPWYHHRLPHQNQSTHTSSSTTKNPPAKSVGWGAVRERSCSPTCRGGQWPTPLLSAGRRGMDLKFWGNGPVLNLLTFISLLHFLILIRSADF